MSMLISTDDVCAADRFDYVREVTTATWVPMECDSEHRADYRGELRASGLGPMQVVVLDVMPITVRRTARLISAADPDLMKMLLVCDGGSSVVEQDGRQGRLSPAEFAVYDTRRPYDVVCGAGAERPVRLLTFMFPPSLLPFPASRLRELTALRFRPTTGLGELTSRFLLQLAEGIEHYSPAEAARLSTAALEVLATRLAQELDLRDWGTTEARRHALLTTVQGFIQQH